MYVYILPLPPMQMACPLSHDQRSFCFACLTLSISMHVLGSYEPFADNIINIEYFYSHQRKFSIIFQHLSIYCYTLPFHRSFQCFLIFFSNVENSICFVLFICLCLLFGGLFSFFAGHYI